MGQLGCRSVSELGPHLLRQGGHNASVS
jgi:hypothetical protein